MDANKKVSDKEIFESPALLAKWVHKNLVAAWPIEDDYGLASDAETLQSQSITSDEVERLAREESLLRVVGVLLFVRQTYPNEFYQCFFSDIYKPLTTYRYAEPSPAKQRLEETRDALDQYINCWEADKSEGGVEQVQKLYVQRIYQDDERCLSMYTAGIGTHGINRIMATHIVFRDAHCKVTTGVSYEQLMTLHE